jgi:uncharacterized protein (DUF2384 family)
MLTSDFTVEVEPMSSAFANEVIFIHTEGHLSGPDIARATGAADSTIRSWLARTREPSRGDTADRVAELSAIVERLMRIMEPTYIPVWMRKPIPALDDRKPLDVIREGGYREVSKIVAALESPPAA